MTSFIRDPNSRTSLLADYVTHTMRASGDVVSYAEAADVVGFDDFDDSAEARNVVSKIVGDVNRRLHNDGDWRLLVCVPNVGYRIASPAECHDVHTARQRRSTRQQRRSMAAALRVVTHPDASPEEQRRATDVAAAQSELLQLMRRRQQSMRGVWRRPETSPVEQ